MIASLMMYARPELEEAHAHLWGNIRARLAARGINAPYELSQTAPPFTVWEDPDLVMSQTCGMPFRTLLRDKVKLVATPDYGLEGCPAGYYRSVIVARQDDTREQLSEFATARLAYNAPHSQSGFAALYTHVKPLGFWFAQRVMSGGHLASAHMVADGRADIAALDAQTWRLIERYEPAAEKLRVLDYTAPTPGLPYITSTQRDPEDIFDAVRSGIAALTPQDAAALDLRGLVRLPSQDYFAVPNPPAAAAA